VLPEGNTFYALTRTEAPSRWETIVPGVLSPREEKTNIADLKGASEQTTIGKFIDGSNRVIA
jgi:hypothetical protein